MLRLISPKFGWIIIIINNWPNDLHLNYKPNVDLKDYSKVEIGLVKDNYELIEEVEYFKELKIDED